MKSYRIQLIGFVFLIGVFLGGIRLHHYLTQPAPPAEEKRSWSPLERDLDAAVAAAGQGSGSDLLKAAIADPEALLATDDSGASQATPAEPETQEPPPAVAASELDGLQLEPAFPGIDAPEESPAVEGTRQMFASFDSLRRPEVAEADSELNQDIIRRMEAMRPLPGSPLPVPYGESRAAGRKDPR